MYEGLDPAEVDGGVSAEAIDIIFKHWTRFVWGVEREPKLKMGFVVPSWFADVVVVTAQHQI